MTKRMKNILIVLGVILEAGIVLFFGFAEEPVSRLFCLIIWCLLAFWICHLAEEHSSHVRRRGRLCKYGRDCAIFGHSCRL